MYDKSMKVSELSHSKQLTVKTETRTQAPLGRVNALQAGFLHS